MTYALRLLRAVALVQARKQGRVVFNRIASNSPETLCENSLHQLIELTHHAAEPDN